MSDLLDVEVYPFHVMCKATVEKRNAEFEDRFGVKMTNYVMEDGDLLVRVIGGTNYLLKKDRRNKFADAIRIPTENESRPPVA